MARPAVALPFITLLALSAACGRSAPPDTITASELRDRIAILADDAMEGRKPGTPGGARAEAYVARAFRDAGLAPGATGGDYARPVAFLDQTARTGAARFAGPGGRIALTADQVSLLGREPIVSLRDRPLYLVGADALMGRRDPRLSGAVLLLDGREDGGGPGWAERARGLQVHRPAAILVIAGPDWGEDWRKPFAGRIDPAAGPAPAIRGVLSRETAARLAGAASRRLDGPTALLGRIDLVARTGVRRFTASNIVGKVAGSDPKAGAVLLSAHWDHIGLCRPAGAPDRICNGANDNGSGVAMLIEVARRIAAGPRPVRDVWFVATTAEEMGLLGMRALADMPPVPLDRIVAALNLDTAVIAPAGMPVAMIGRGRTPALDAVLDRVAEATGRTVDRDDEAGVMFERQDGYELARRGVPAVMVSGSFSDFTLLKAYLGKDYHQPSDDLAHLPDLAGAAEDATLHVALIRALADPARYAGPGRPAHPALPTPRETK